MATLEEIEKAVERLSLSELQVFRAWFAEHDAIAWDVQFESDVAQGKLDALADEAMEDLRSGRSTEL